MAIPNLDAKTVEGFGEEWSYYDQSSLSEPEIDEAVESYFRVFPWEVLPEEPVGFDLGCGSGRWARRIAPRVGRLHCIDASAEALAVARRNLRHQTNCEFHLASVDSVPLEDGSMDFGYSVGVLHHVPDTAAAIRACVEKLKPGAPLLLYLYYAFDNRPWWFRALWRASDLGRLVIASLPTRIKIPVSQLIAAFVYWPLARMSRGAERAGVNVDAFPLSFYRNYSFYVMKTDALDRSGTRLERRFSASEIKNMMESAGLEGIRFSDEQPYWCAAGVRR